MAHIELGDLYGYPIVYNICPVCTEVYLTSCASFESPLVQRIEDWTGVHYMYHNVERRLEMQLLTLEANLPFLTAGRDDWNPPGG